MLRLVIISLVCVVLSEIVQSQRRTISVYRSQQPIAEDRRYHWIKDLKKQEKLKYRHFKKHFKKCGISYPFKFKLFRRSDDGDLDTIHIVVPYGYSGEYFPKSEFEYQPEVSTPRVVYSVKYRDSRISDPDSNLGTNSSFELS